MVGLQPKGTKGAIPRDIRSEHYGVVHGRHIKTRARLLLVDRRTPQQIRLIDDMQVVV